MTIIQDSIRSERRVTYGLILRRKAGQCLVMDGPSRLFFLHGECEALVIQQSEPSQPKNVGTTDNSIEISGPAIVVFIAGGGRVGIKAPRSTRALRGELLQGLFAENPLLAALACRHGLVGTPTVQLQSANFHITHVRRTEGTLCPT